MHARKAILGLDTVKNRSVPPLRHEWVLALVQHFPQLRFSINGGVKSLDEARALLAQVRVRVSWLGLGLGLALTPTLTLTLTLALIPTLP